MHVFPFVFVVRGGGACYGRCFGVVGVAGFVCCYVADRHVGGSVGVSVSVCWCWRC